MMHVHREATEQERRYARRARPSPSSTATFTSAAESFGNLYRTTASDIELRARIANGQVALELFLEGAWEPFGPLDILEVTGPAGSYSPDVVLRVGDVIDSSGAVTHEVWGETELGVTHAAWMRSGTGVCCKLPMPPASDQVNWIKFTIGATPIDAQSSAPAPVDPIGIIRKDY